MSSDVERVLYREAQLLDAGQFHEWLKLLAPDLRYWAPVRADLPRSREQESEAKRLPLFDETKASLSLRVDRLDTGLAWVEIPAPRTRRFITNVLSEPAGEGLVHVRSNFMLFRSRSFTEEWIVVGCREDTWSTVDGWLLRERKILLDHCTVENLPFFL